MGRKKIHSTTITVFHPIIHFPVLLGLGTFLIACVYDPKGAFDTMGNAVIYPIPINFTKTGIFLTSPIVWILWILISLGLYYEYKTAVTSKRSKRERFAMVWALMNGIWFHIGCDVFSGLFQIMPNLTELYYILNKDHLLPRHSEHRIVMDIIYWFELLIEAPLAFLVFYLFLTKKPSRWVIEAWLHGMHLGGYVAYYIPDIVLGITTHPLISNLDRSIAFCWVVIPAYLTYDTVMKGRIADTGKQD
jgi:hypothetical protein